ncbi:MAG: M23 family metallopeptidase [Actinomycetota bacterium]
MSELEGARVVAFPLLGEWRAAHSPASRIPSHGTDQLGQRYAFDLWRVDMRAGGYHPASTARTLLFGVRTDECYGWGETVHAAFDGEVVHARDGAKERAWLHPLRELLLVLGNAVTFRASRLDAILGNHVVVRNAEYHALFAHLAPGSVVVRPGQALREGDVIGRVGSTGNSTAPHLHFQLMDRADLLTAAAIPSAFREYEALRNGRWERVEGGIPRTTERIRSVAGNGRPPRSER